MAKSASAAGMALGRKESCNAGNVTSDGRSLWSYGWWEMAVWIRDTRDGSTYVLVRAGRGYSPSTSCQFSRARLYQYEKSPVETERGSAAMALPDWAERLGPGVGPRESRFLDPNDGRLGYGWPA